MNKSKARGTSQSISIHEMRFEFERVLRAVQAGRTLTLIYRNKPLARIVPFKAEPELTADAGGCPNNDISR